jgi:hypothetical protein
MRILIQLCLSVVAMATAIESARAASDLDQQFIGPPKVRLLDDRAASKLKLQGHRAVLPNPFVRDGQSFMERTENETPWVFSVLLPRDHHLRNAQITINRFSRFTQPPDLFGTIDQLVVPNRQLAKVQLLGGYIKIGQSPFPFLFNRYVQGHRSSHVSGEIRPVKWLAVGGTYGYNQLFYSRLQPAFLLEADRLCAPKLLQMMWPHLL